MLSVAETLAQEALTAFAKEATAFLKKLNGLSEMTVNYNLTMFITIAAIVTGTVVATKFWLNRLEAWEKSH